MWGGGFKKQLTCFSSTCLGTSLLLFSLPRKNIKKVRTMENKAEVVFVPEMTKWLIAKTFAEDKITLVEGH